MELIDTIIQLQRSGMTNEQIILTLQSQGYSPKDINESINQAQIKDAFNQTGQGESAEVQIPSPEYQQGYPQQQYQQDYSQTDQSNYSDNYPNYYQDVSSGEYQQDYNQQPSYDTETITEIAEQVISERFKEFNQRNGDISLFKNTMQDKVNDIDARLKRIESTIDKLQQAIIQKIGEFGENTISIKRDVANLHDTTSKLMNPLIDNYRELQKIKKK